MGNEQSNGHRLGGQQQGGGGYSQVHQAAPLRSEDGSMAAIRAAEKRIEAQSAILAARKQKKKTNKSQRYKKYHDVSDHASQNQKLDANLEQRRQNVNQSASATSVKYSAAAVLAKEQKANASSRDFNPFQTDEEQAHRTLRAQKAAARVEAKGGNTALRARQAQTRSDNMAKYDRINQQQKNSRDRSKAAQSSVVETQQQQQQPIPPELAPVLAAYKTLTAIPNGDRSIELCSKIVKKMVLNAAEVKYRKIPLTSKKMQTVIVEVDAAMALMTALGFEVELFPDKQLEMTAYLFYDVEKHDMRIPKLVIQWLEAQQA